MITDYSEITSQFYKEHKRLQDLLSEKKWEAAGILAACMATDLKDLSYWCAEKYKESQ